MLYAYEVKEQDGKYVGYVYDIDMTTKPLNSADEVDEALMQAFSGYIEIVYRRKRKPIPLPLTNTDDKYALYIPIKLQLKIHLWNTMLEKHINQTELAQMLGVSRMAVNQMVGEGKNTSVERYENTLKLLEKYPCISIN
ncbi:helix-turn-helix domain-containing protein [Anaerobiospirillum thomasii]|uniref:Antitoxin HicB n=1 Tax=Anaerobiospirillum thomasii TaxID=179995 RepID=A0A2X0XJA3_9GAMM|nr:hypothetical protein [Anaerobiospirillum thomasii]SPT70053.1 Uncharacterised protein [Anaerobiospirillum thomasii]SPT78982.1 Uncharacterised protein [Anaerobiospirillum thomasii]